MHGIGSHGRGGSADGTAVIDRCCSWRAPSGRGAARSTARGQTGTFNIAGGDMQTSLPLVDLVTRLGLATLAGMIIGLEREWRQKPAGLRTHMLVSLAAAAFTIITFELFQASLAMAPDSKGDPVRVIEGVIAGVAFLGAGTIIQGRGEVKGLTTGASIWLTGATGLACGGGYYVIAGIIVGLAVVILAVLGLLERKEESPVAK
jgi:putative Mg2+ transporter-C (MgtC) family protein